jgi:hypothetical protein
VTCKSYDIPKTLVWEAWLRVKANHGAAGDRRRDEHRPELLHSSPHRFVGDIQPTLSEQVRIRRLGTPRRPSASGADSHASCFSTATMATSTKPLIKPSCSQKPFSVIMRLGLSLRKKGSAWPGG